MNRYIAYYRVSTQKQGNSGLGLEAQKTMVKHHLKTDDILLEEYEEVESGKNDNLPQLQKAIEHCKNMGAILLIAKLDRLSRNAGFIFLLKDSQVNFKCCDMPEANSLTIGIMAVLAQEERELISKRTIAALEELRNKGKKLGNPKNLTYEAQKQGAEAMKNKALNKATALIVSLRETGKSYAKIAQQLNDNGFKTSRGYNFSASQVLILYDRYVNSLAK